MVTKALRPEKAAVTVHHDRLHEVLRQLVDAYLSKKYLYTEFHAHNGSAPQHWGIPRGVVAGSLEHRLFLFFTTVLTIRSESDAVFRQMVRLYKEQPVLFDPQVAGVMELSEVQALLKDVGYIHPNQGASRWIVCAGGLGRRFGGDPLNIFLGRKSIDEVYRSIQMKGGKKLLSGFGPKLLSLLALFYEELELVPCLEGVFPVDLHVQRICITLGIVTGSGIVDAAYTLAEVLRTALWEACRDMGINPFDAAHAFWFLGSKGCWQCHRVSGIEQVCPLASECSGNHASTALYHRKGRWDFDDQRRRPKGVQQGALPGLALEVLKRRGGGSRNGV
ncbi:MAG: hypothetical protein A2675_02405 [Candidatus Yonathbacteria bacterium RIFCSPHIGHO2_01_FULL_51_10]|uniref:HhH-GPD domain-containing protein n=1 Tax=Candidatus Yonathbacteria bacterium RIFCSPHIGHO2_01_FULL_51_10 TaxID=1802723 RepID=A0A1G2S823_9BACT|nr:MAG: hypothetical protein A2675_02405 [Candidatus Yonathbacteria bacterium RIFCSPHIGHO2_01_FULL_51_10]